MQKLFILALSVLAFIGHRHPDTFELNPFC